MFSVPLRRALVTGSDLPYPEGVAAAEVLKVGAAKEGDVENARGLRVIIIGSIISAAFQIVAAMKLAAAELTKNFKLGASATGMSTSWSMALIGVGHLVGLSVGAAMFFGMLIAWAGLMPWLTAGVPGELDTVVNTVFRSEVRFIGAGTIGVAAIWSLIKILGPIIGGMRSAFAAQRARQGGQLLELSERDLPISIVLGVSLLTLVPIAWLLWTFSAGGPVHDHPFEVIAGTLVYVVVIGVIIAAVCGYMAGLIGASNSPVSGVGILAVIAASLLLVMIFGNSNSDADTKALVAYALFATAIVFSVATISNDNLQDLKTGQLVGATPWKQQFALVLGVIFGSLVIPPILDLLNTAFTFQGAPGAKETALAAPQAALISSLAKGVLGGDLTWTMLGWGALAGVGFVLVDELLGRLKLLRLPPLAIGIGVYLPMSVILPVTIGSVVGWFYDRWADRRANPELARRLGTLTATGMIVGESLWGVAFAGIVAASGSDTPLAVVGDAFEPVGLIGGTILFALLVWGLYRRTMRATG
jgi:putative OPT family oligopeptide transporter